jgi:phage FluMu gp28-like protein
MTTSRTRPARSEKPKPKGADPAKAQAKRPGAVPGGPLDELKTSPGDRASPPPVLLPYQRKWIEDQSPFKVCEKSRRIGMTWAEAADNVLIAAADKAAGGQNVYYLGTDKEMTEEYIEACKMWARAFDRGASEIEQGFWEEDEADKHIQTFTLRFPKSGHKIVGLASVPSKLRGRQGVLVGDESAFMRFLKQLIKAAMAFLLWGGKVRLLSTHFGADNEFNELIQEIRAGKRKGSVHRVTFKEAVEQGLYKRVCLRRGIEWTAEGEKEWVADAYGFYGDDAEEELDVVPSQSGGAFLPIALIEARMAPDTPLARGAWKSGFALEPLFARQAEMAEWCERELKPALEAIPTDARLSAGGDFGRVADLTSYDLVNEQPNLVLRVMLHVELRSCPFDQQEQVLFYLLDFARDRRRLKAGALDAGGLGWQISERAAQRYGSLVIEQVKLTEQIYIEEMPKFKAAFQDGTIEGIPRDREVRDDLRALRVINGVPKLPKGKTQKAGGEKLTRHGDAAISLFLAHKAARRDVTPIEFQALGRVRETRRMHDYMET